MPAGVPAMLRQVSPRASPSLIRRDPKGRRAQRQYPKGSWVPENRPAKTGALHLDCRDAQPSRFF